MTRTPKRRRARRGLVGTAVVLVVLVLLVITVRQVNAWRFGTAADVGDPQDLSTYALDQEGMSVEHITGDYLNGFHLVPDEATRDGVVVTFGGSEGSPDYERAVGLAAEGYEVYSLFFFGQDNQRPQLDRVPLEFFDELLDRLDDDAGPVTVLGSSKGAELALLLATDYPEIDNVVLYAPTVHVFQALAGAAESHSSWTRDGQEVPFLYFRDASPGALMEQLSATAFNFPVAYRATYESVVEGADPADVEAATLDPRAVTGGLLVFAGGDDAMWQGDTAAHRIDEDMPDAQVHVYPEAGHVFRGDGRIGMLETGGTAEANEAAGRDAEQALLETLTAWHD